MFDAFDYGIAKPTTKLPTLMSCQLFGYLVTQGCTQV